MPNAEPDPRITRFRDDVSKILRRAPSDKTPMEDNASPVFAIAVSGGPDSMALLWLASRAFPGRVIAATVDHGFRPEARDEAEMVRKWCEGAGVPHRILLPSAPIEGSVQAAARAVRYALLHEWAEHAGVNWLMTAHHADDQCETMLMRLNRSSGVGGLAGVRSRNGSVMRPLLDWRRVELRAIVEEKNVPFVLDPSNDNVNFDRVAVRKKLADVDWLDPLAVSRSAEACNEADQALQWVTSDLADRYITDDERGGVTLSQTDFPAEIQRRLLLHMLCMASGGENVRPPRGDALDRALACLMRGEKSSLGDWLLTGGKVWSVKAAPPRRGKA